VSAVIEELASKFTVSFSIVPVSAKQAINLEALASEVLRSARPRVAGKGLREGIRVEAGPQASKG
jgi:hypothetical protein